MVKRQTALAIKREIKKNELTLKDLIDKFYEIEEEHLIKDYIKGLNMHFTYITTNGLKSSVNAAGEKCINIEDYLTYMLDKKIKGNPELIAEICKGESAP